MSNRFDPTPNFNIVMRVNMVTDLPIKSVSGFTKANEYEYIKEGGVNDYVHMVRKQVSQPFTFTVERYTGADAMGDPLTLGAIFSLPLMLIVSDLPGKFIGSAVRRYYIFTGAEVMSKEYGELNAESSGLLIERSTIAYKQLIVTNFPRVSPIE